ncbi:MAG: hypothetical protein ACRDJP_07880 [Actinomycetota bacterium]
MGIVASVSPVRMGSSYRRTLTLTLFDVAACEFASAGDTALNLALAFTFGLSTAVHVASATFEPILLA